MISDSTSVWFLVFSHLPCSLVNFGRVLLVALHTFTSFTVLYQLERLTKSRPRPSSEEIGKGEKRSEIDVLHQNIA